MTNPDRGARGRSHAARLQRVQATGIFWKPVWHALEEEVELVLANAAHIKNVPGRKTDVNDATWIADLLAHGSSAAASSRKRRSRSCAR